MFALSFAARLVEEGANSIGGDADYSKALKDAFMSALVVFSYGATAIIIFKFIFFIKTYVGDMGSFGVILNQYGDNISALNEAAEKAAAAQEGWGWGLNQLFDLASVPVEAISAGCFSISYAILLMIHLFMRYAYAVMFCFLFTWGAIAIATKPSSVLSMEGGFVSTLKGLLIWPIVESIFYVLAGLMIDNAGTKIVDVVNTTSSVRGLSFSTAYFVFTFINIFLSAVIASAAFVSFYLSQNQSAMAGILAPFLMGGMSAGSFIKSRSQASSAFLLNKSVKYGKEYGGKAGKKIGSIIGNLIKDQER